MAAQTSTAALSMKLFIDTKSQRVLFAEAGRDVVDFLYSLLGLPLATAVRLVGVGFVEGSAAGTLHHCAEIDARLRRSATVSYSPGAAAASLFLMPASSFEPSRVFFRCQRNNARSGRCGIGVERCCLYMTDARGTRCPNCGDPMAAKLRHVSSVKWPDWTSPEAAVAAGALAGDGSLPLTPAPPAARSSEPSRILFRCERQYTPCRVRGGCNLYMADVRGTACPNCGNPMTDTLHYVSPVWPRGLFDPTPSSISSGGGGGGSAQEQDQEAAAANYTVADDLHITRNGPMSPTSSAERLRRMCAVTDLVAVEERTVRVGYIKGLQILKALLHSKTVLTDVFVYKAPA